MCVPEGATLSLDQPGHRVVDLCVLCTDENVQELAVELVQLGFISEVRRGHNPCDLTACLQPQAQNTPAGYRGLRMRHSDNLPFKWGPEFSFLSSRATSHDSLRFWKRPSRSSTAGTDSWIQSPSPHSRGASPPLSSTPPLSSSSPTGLCCRTQKKLLWESFAGTWGTLGLSLSHPPTRCFSIFVLMLLVYFV